MMKYLYSIDLYGAAEARTCDLPPLKRTLYNMVYSSCFYNERIHAFCNHYEYIRKLISSFLLDAHFDNSRLDVIFQQCLS